MVIRRGAVEISFDVSLLSPLPFFCLEAKDLHVVLLGFLLYCLEAKDLQRYP